MSEEEMVLTSEDFVDSDFIMVRPKLVKKFGGNVPAVLMIARIQFRCELFTPHADGYSWWKATYPELAAQTGLSPQQARRVVDGLVDKGIVRAKIENESSWDRTRSYRVDVRQMHVSDSTDGCAGIDTSHVSDSTDLLSTKEVLKKKPITTTPAPTEPDLFDEFWTVYPAKKGKIAAKKAWGRAIKVAQAGDIIAGAMVYRTDGRVLAGYIKDPATWLNGGHWADELSPAGTRGGHRAYQDPADLSAYLEEL